MPACRGFDAPPAAIPALTTVARHDNMKRSPAVWLGNSKACLEVPTRETAMDLETVEIAS